MLIFVVLIALSYASLMIALKKGWSRLETPLYDYETPENRFSIVIPFRNEAENLPELLESLLLLNYPLERFEIFLVNDGINSLFLFKKYQLNSDGIFEENL